MRRTSQPRQQDHGLPALAPQRRGGRISAQQKADPCAEQRQKSSTVSAVSGLRHTISTKTAPETYGAGVFCRLWKQNFAATLRHCGEADFSALCPMDAQSVVISFGGMSDAVPLRKEGGRRLTRPLHRLGDRIPPFRIPYRQDCGHRTRPARTIPGGDSRRPMYPVEIIS